MTTFFQDALTDMAAVGCPLHIEGLEESSSTCHSAMLDCARYIQSRLETLKLLDAAFAALPVSVFCMRERERGLQYVTWVQ